jgi:uncharacterized membrane protein
VDRVVRRWLVAGASLALLAIAVGLRLATWARWDSSGCFPEPGHHGPCDPRLVLPYFVPGAVTFALGVLIGLAVVAVAIIHRLRHPRAVQPG